MYSLNDKSLKLFTYIPLLKITHRTSLFERHSLSFYSVSFYSLNFYSLSLYSLTELVLIELLLIELVLIELVLIERLLIELLLIELLLIEMHSLKFTIIERERREEGPDRWPKLSSSW